MSKKQKLQGILKRPAQQSIEKINKQKKRVPTLHEEMEREESQNDANLFDEQPKTNKNKTSQSKKEVEENDEKKKIQKLLDQIRKQKETGIKKKTITINQKLNIKFDLDKKWDTVIQNEKKGPFSQQQQQILYKSICQYAVQNDLTLKQIQQQILFNVNPDKKKAMWTTICSVIPRRSINACFKFLKRKMDPKNNQGHWTKQQVDQLMLLVEQHHTKWTKISKQLNRTPQNVRDKYRSIGQQKNNQRNSGFWKIQQLINLLQAIQKETKVKFLNSQYKTKITDFQLHDNYETKQREGRKRSSKNFMFHNLSTLITFINFTKLNKLLQNPQQINWSQIVQKIVTKSKDDCKNKWKQILNIAMIKTNTFTSQQDNILIDTIASQEPQYDYDINFNNIENNHSASENKTRWNVLKKFVSGRFTKNVSEVLKQMKSKKWKRRQQSELLPDTQQNRILKMFAQMKKVKDQLKQDDQ